MGVPHSDAAILGLPAGPIPKGDALAGVSDKTLSATLTITMGHDTKPSVPFAGFGALDAHPSNAVQPLGKSALVLHLDDSTAPVSAPTNVSAFDIGALLNQLSRQFGGVGAAATLSSCPGAAAPGQPVVERRRRAPARATRAGGRPTTAAGSVPPAADPARAWSTPSLVTSSLSAVIAPAFLDRAPGYAAD